MAETKKTTTKAPAKAKKPAVEAEAPVEELSAATESVFEGPKEEKTIEEVSELTEKVLEQQAANEAIAKQEEEEQKENEAHLEETQAIINEVHEESIKLNDEINAHPEKAEELTKKELEHLDELEKKVVKKSKFKNNVIMSWNGVTLS